MPLRHARSVGPLRLDASAPGFEQEFAAFLGRNRDADENVDRVVAEIIADVRARGDAAVVEYTRKFDHVETDAPGLRISDAERHAAAAKVPPAQREALSFAAKRIPAFILALGLHPLDDRYADFRLWRQRRAVGESRRHGSGQKDECADGKRRAKERVRGAVR